MMRGASRRTVLTAVAAATALAPLAGMAGGTATLAVFQADEAVARDLAARWPARMAIDGDRVRFARRVFGELRPGRVVGLTRYADYLLLADAAREQGYRVMLGKPPRESLVVWTASLPGRRAMRIGS